jgi:dTDP-4-dehydrorhamnose 3,5-epimerase
MLPDNLFPGFSAFRLTTHPDDRGTFTELFRQEWGVGVEPIQWNIVRSEAGVLRGVHVHPRHTDYLIIVDGEATIGLRDLRRGSATEGKAATIQVDGEQMTGLSIPPGVAHGFLFHTKAMHVYSVSHYWDLADELGCHWADPALEIDWPLEPTLVSPRDAEAGSLSDLLAELAPFQPIGR